MGKLENEIIIDYGSWDVPTDWSQITLEKFQKMEGKNDLIEMIAALTNHTRDEVMQLPQEIMERLLSEMDFLLTPMEQQPPTNKIEIDGETYQINVMEKLKTGEWLSFDMAMREDSKNFATFLGILCRKENEIYDSTFENEVLPERIKMYEKAPITKVMPIVSFFLQLWMVLNSPTQLSIQVEEAINQERQNIQNLYNDGQVSRRTMKSAMKTLKKLEKTINGI